MPLMKSKSPKAFSSNVSAEMHAGKPQKQALAIAYSVKRKARKMAHGGMVNDEESSEDVEAEDKFLAPEGDSEPPFHSDGSDEADLEESGFLPEAHMDNEHGDEEEMQSRSGILADIMKKVRMRNMGK